MTDWLGLCGGYDLFPFVPDDFPDRRLYTRSRRIGQALLQGAMHDTPQTEVQRLGARRLHHNARLKADALLAASARASIARLVDAPVILSAEDTVLCRVGGGTPPDDAGRLRSTQDLGYVAHCAFAITPGTGKPCGWLGAHVWTRADAPVRAQDHKTRAPADRESAKWSALRTQIQTALRAAGATGRIISLNDREGDAWTSLSEAVTATHELITRATQNRRIEESERGLKAYLRRRPRATTIVLNLYRTIDGVPTVRPVTLSLRWARVHLLPPRGTPPEQRRPLPVVAILLTEPHPPAACQPFESWLLTTCPVATDDEAVQVASWYTERWGCEVGNDVLKNAIEIEHPVLADVAAFKRLLAVSGPAAAQVAQWVALARQPKPPPVATVFEPAMLADLRLAHRHFLGAPAPTRWSVRTVVETLARIGGANLRAGRHAGWRVVWRGYKRVVEFRKTLQFLRRDPTALDPKPIREPCDLDDE